MSMTKQFWIVLAILTIWCLCLGRPAFAALPSTGVGEVETTGSDSNAGIFDPGISGAGTDYTQGAGQAATALTGGVTCAIATTTATLTGYTVSAADKGNFIQVITGSGLTPGYYEITGDSTIANTWTLDRTAGTGTVTSGTLGGAWLSPGVAAGAMTVSNETFYVKNGTYSITSTSNNVAGGKITTATGVNMVGYSSSRTLFNTGTPPLIQASGISSVTLVSAGTTSLISNIKVDGASLTSTRGINLANYAESYNCIGVNCKNNALVVNTGGLAVGFYATGCATQAAISCTGGAQSMLYACAAISNTNVGIVADCPCLFCISASNTTGYQVWNNGYMLGDAAYKNSSYGFDCSVSVSNSLNMINCIAYSNSNKGFYTNAYSGVIANFMLINCAYANNTNGNVDTGWQNVGGVLLTADPTTNGGSGDFSLNTTTGGGAACRAAGYPGAFPSSISTTGHLDIGAVQHADPAGGGNTYKRTPQ